MYRDLIDLASSHACPSIRIETHSGLTNWAELNLPLLIGTWKCIIRVGILVYLKNGLNTNSFSKFFGNTVKY